MARDNFVKYDRMAGDDFTKYPLGAFNPSGPYDGPFAPDFNAGSAGTFSIVGGLEANGKNVLKAAFNNPSIASGHGQQAWVYLGPTTIIPVSNSTFPYNPMWARIRFRCPPTLFSTTAFPLFSGQKFWSNLFNLASSSYSSAIPLFRQTYNIIISPIQNNSTGNFYLNIHTTQQENDFGGNDPVQEFNTVDCFSPTFYQDDTWHEIIVYWNGTSMPLVWKVWVDGVLTPLISTTSFYQFPRSKFPQVPRAAFIWEQLGILAQGSGVPSNPAQDFYYISMWEILDANKYFNPYVVLNDNVLTTFNSYVPANSDGTIQFYDTNGSLVILAFRHKAGQVLPQVQFVDDSESGTLNSIPMIESGDWIDILAGNTLIQRFLYSATNVNQIFLVDIHGLGDSGLITIARNRSNPRIRTSGANTHSLSVDRRNKDLNPLGYLVGNNRPTTTLTEGEKRRTR